MEVKHRSLGRKNLNLPLVSCDLVGYNLLSFYCSHTSIIYLSGKKKSTAQIPGSSQGKLLLQYFVAFSSQEFLTNKLESTDQLGGFIQQTAMLFCVAGSHYLPYKTCCFLGFLLERSLTSGATSLASLRISLSSSSVYSRSFLLSFLGSQFKPCPTFHPQIIKNLLVHESYFFTVKCLKTLNTIVITSSNSLDN